MSNKKSNIKNKPETSTQKYLYIDTIQDSVVILKDGGLRAVLMTSSVNFDLKSTDEQDAIIFAYQNFINSLDFPIQIQISSRVLNINGYLRYLEEFQQTQRNELLRIQTAEYAQFISELVSQANIVNKTFYLVIPFDPIENKEGLLDKLSNAMNPKIAVRYGKQDFEKYKTQLWQRVNGVMYGLKRAGIYMTPLNTQELIELYYSLYNPDSEPTESLHNLSELDIT
jgi:type IV secretory pathway VirB4 component